MDSLSLVELVDVISLLSLVELDVESLLDEPSLDVSGLPLLASRSSSDEPATLQPAPASTTTTNHANLLGRTRTWYPAPKSQPKPRQIAHASR